MNLMEFEIINLKCLFFGFFSVQFWIRKGNSKRFCFCLKYRVEDKTKAGAGANT